MRSVVRTLVIAVTAVTLALAGSDAATAAAPAPELANTEAEATRFAGWGEGVEPKEVIANAEADARRQAAGAGFEDCHVVEFFVGPIAWLVPPPPGSPLWFASVTVECRGG